MSTAFAFLLLPPSPSQRLIELDKTAVFVTAGFSKSQFRRIKGTLAIENFEVGGCATLVTNLGEAHGFFQVCHGLLLARSHFVMCLVADQRVGDITKCSLNGLPIFNESLLIFRFRQAQVAAQRAPR